MGWRKVGVNIEDVQRFSGDMPSRAVTNHDHATPVQSMGAADDEPEDRDCLHESQEAVSLHMYQHSTVVRLWPA